MTLNQPESLLHQVLASDAYILILLCPSLFSFFSVCSSPPAWPLQHPSLRASWSCHPFASTFAFGLDGRSSHPWRSLGHALHSPSGSLYSWLIWPGCSESWDPAGMIVHPAGIPVPHLGCHYKPYLPRWRWTLACSYPFTPRLKPTIWNQYYKSYGDTLLFYTLTFSTIWSFVDPPSNDSQRLKRIVRLPWVYLG